MGTLGDDFNYFLPHMLDTYLFTQLNPGEVHWWTPSFGGGLPVFPHPVMTQLSLPQLLLSFLEPLRMLQTSFVIYSFFGMLFFYLFLRERLQLKVLSALVGALLFGANGFFIQHFFVGHVSYFVYPLISPLLFLLFRRNNLLSEILCLSLIWAYGIYAGGYFVNVLWIFSLPIVGFFVFFREKAPLREVKLLLFKVALSGFLGVLLSSAKLFAILSFMRQFPRSIQGESFSLWFNVFTAFLVQLFGAPLFALGAWAQGDSTLLVELVDKSQRVMGLSYGYWEKDSALPLLALGLFLFFTPRLPAGFSFLRKNSRTGSQRFFLLGIFLCFWLICDLVAANGLFYFFLKRIPPFSSLHVNCRFTALLLPFLCMSLAVLAEKFPYRKILASLLALSLLHQVFFYGLFFRQPNPSLSPVPYLESFRHFYYQAKEAPESFPSIEKLADLNDNEALFSSQSSYQVQEPLFGYGAGNLRELHLGSLRDSDSLNFNTYFPPSFVWPQFYGTELKSRIPLNDLQNLEAFLARKKPQWPLPPLQTFFNRFNLGLLLLLLLVLGLNSARRFFKLSADAS